MAGITPVSLESMIALNKSAPSAVTEGGDLNRAVVEKAFLSLLLDNLNLIGMGSISGDKSIGQESHLLIDQVFKDWLIEQQVGLGGQSSDKSEV